MSRTVHAVALCDGARRDAGNPRMGREAGHDDGVRADDGVVSHRDVAHDAGPYPDVDPILDGGPLGELGSSSNAHRRVVADVHVVANRSGRENHAAVMPDPNSATELDGVAEVD